MDHHIHEICIITYYVVTKLMKALPPQIFDDKRLVSKKRRTSVFNIARDAPQSEVANKVITFIIINPKEQGANHFIISIYYQIISRNGSKKKSVVF
jgi:hypothetical protein